MKIEWNQQSGKFVVTWGDTSVEINAGDPRAQAGPRRGKLHGKAPANPLRQKKKPKKQPAQPTEDLTRPMPVPPPGVMGYAVITRKGVVSREIKNEAEFERAIREEIVRFAHKNASQRKQLSPSIMKVKKLPSGRTLTILDVGLDKEPSREEGEVTGSVLHSRTGVVGLRLYKR